MVKRNEYSYKILFIEDEKNLVDIYHDAFESVDIKMLSTDNVDDGLLVARREKPDLILLDLILPVHEGTVMNLGKEEGYRFMEIAREDKVISKIPIIVFTNLDNRQARQFCKEMGAKEYIVKANHTPLQAVKKIKEFL